MRSVAGQRDAQPVRPVGQFVFDLVERLFEQEEVEQPFGGCRVGRPQPACRSWSRGRRRGTPRAARSRQSPSAAPSLPCSSGASLQRALERRGRRIVDRADQAGDVARRAAPCAGARPGVRRGSPSKSMMKMSSLTISIWPRWKSPWWRMFRPSMSRGSSALRRSRQGVALRQQLVDQRRGRLPSDRVAPLPQRVEHALGAGHDVARSSAATSSGRIGSGAKSGSSSAAGEREMHLGDAPSGLRHVAQIGDLLLAFAGMFARREQPLLLDEAVEIGRGHGPGVALVLRRRRARPRSRCACRPRPVRRCRAAPACWRSRRPR